MPSEDACATLAQHVFWLRDKQKPYRAASSSRMQLGASSLQQSPIEMTCMETAHAAGDAQSQHCQGTQAESAHELPMPSNGQWSWQRACTNSICKTASRMLGKGMPIVHK